jgi:branched-chain amino acid transport system substrate-binding protein
MRLRRWLARCLVLVCVVGVERVVPALADEIVIGGQCDRTGPTKPVGIQLCAGILDYVKLVNKQGGVNGHTLRYIEVEHGNQLDRGIEAYERLKREGAVAVLDYGTPIVYALTPRHMADKIPGLTPGHGRADATDGKRYPYIFPMAATYWSQIGAVMQYLKDTGGARKGTKIAYLFYDNSAGREPLPVFNRICALEGYECRDFAVPERGVEMASQVLEITRRMQADWVVEHLFGNAAVSMKEFRRNGFPLNRVVSLVTGAGEEDMQIAGWDTAQGYLGLHATNVGQDFPVIQDLITMYQTEHQKVPEYVGRVNYNGGVVIAALMVEGIRLAIEQEGLPVTGEKVKRGYERIKAFTLGGLLPPLTLTPEDHEGGGWVRMHQTKGKHLVPVTGWFRGYREVVLDEVKKTSLRETEKQQGARQR